MQSSDFDVFDHLPEIPESEIDSGIVTGLLENCVFYQIWTLQMVENLALSIDLDSPIRGDIEELMADSNDSVEVPRSFEEEKERGSEECRKAKKLLKGYENYPESMPSLFPEWPIDDTSRDFQVRLAARSLTNVNTRPKGFDTTGSIPLQRTAFRVKCKNAVKNLKTLLRSLANAQNSVPGLRIENSPIMGEIRFKGSKRYVILQHEARNQQGVTFSDELSEVTFEVDAEEMIPTSKTKQPESDLLNVIFKLRRDGISEDFKITKC
ncbi:unnamed protein product [Angiostrongylus costaricensis]|uniref:Nucleosome assembly protein 1-like 1 n=1 Tax=Angiostrongylus costaricensis TaxID=334426 RepID=A0A158PHT0_ANGCS|nr:unnamed protein product [Angiostrongylus costaricensis]